MFFYHLICSFYFCVSGRLVPFPDLGEVAIVEDILCIPAANFPPVTGAIRSTGAPYVGCVWSALVAWLLWAVWLDVRPCPGQRPQPLVERVSSQGSCCGIPSGPRTSSSSQMGRARFQGGWLWPKVSSVSLLVDWASSWHSLLQLLGCSKASTGLKVGGAEPWGGWLRGSAHFEAGVNLGWWVRTQASWGLCQPASVLAGPWQFRVWRFGGPGVSAHLLVAEARS